MSECSECLRDDCRLWKVNDHRDDFQYMCGECISFTDLWGLVVDDLDGTEDEEANA